MTNVLFNLMFFLGVLSWVFHPDVNYQCADFGISLIIAAIVAAAATTTAGVMQNQATKKANKEGLKLAGIQREDTLSQQKTQEEIAKEQLAISKKAQEMQDREAKMNREERTEERGYQRLQNAANRYSQFLNEQNALVQNRMAPIIGKGK